MPSHVARPAALLLSSTLLAIAAEPLPASAAISGMAANSGTGYGRTVAFSTGDVNGDGYVDIALGGRIYWGSSTGWKGDDYYEPEDPSAGQQLAARAINPYSALWIIPNVTGKGTDNKTRADLVAVDVDGDGHVLHVEPPPAQSPEPVLLSDAYPTFSLTRLVGQPAVGDFTGDSIPDIAWVSDEFGYSYVNLATGESDYTTKSQRYINNHDYAAVAGVDIGQTGYADLLVVRSNGEQSLVERFANGILDFSSETPALTTSLSPNLYRPIITVGEINDDGLADYAVTSPNDDFTVIVASDKNMPSFPSQISGTGVGWILPDVTGDQIGDVSWGDNGFGDGLIHGGDAFSVSAEGIVPAIDRTVPLDQSENPEFRIGRPSGSSIYAFRLAAVPFAVAGGPLSNQLLAIDYSGYQGNFFGFADTRILPKLYPVFGNGQLLPIPAEGGPLVDPSFAVQFTGNGVFDGFAVVISGYQADDVFSYGTLPASVDYVLDNSDTETHTGNFVFASQNGITEADLTELIKNMHYTASANGSVRNLTFVLIGRANGEAGADSAYAGVELSTTAQVGASSIVIDSPPSGTLGGSVPMSISGGALPYHVRATGGVVRVGGVVNGVLKVFVVPTQSGTIHVTVTDANNASVPFDIEVSELARTELPAPALAISTGAATVFGPVCPGTTSGLASLRSALQGSDRRRTRGFAWDSASQSYTELPSEPDGGLTPTDAVFLASRVDLGLDFSGPAVPTGTTILLRAEWNFVGLGPVDDNGSIVTSHSLSSNFSLLDLSGNSASFSDISMAYRWNGTSYEQTDVIESGVGYWIRNVGSDSQPRLLQRNATSLGAPRSPKAVQFARNADAPPAPPSTDTKAQDDGGSCGAGSGIGAMLGMLLAFLRLRSRQR